MSNPLSRMPYVPGTPKTPENQAIQEPEEPAADIPESEKRIADAVLKESKSSESKEDIKSEELLKDLDFDRFYLTGKLDYTFQLHKHLKVKMRLLKADELVATHDFLWKSTEGNNSATVVMLNHSILILSYAMLSYGDTDLSKLTYEERRAFVESLPGMIIPVLSRKYSILEASVNSFFTDAEKVKN